MRQPRLFRRRIKLVPRRATVAASGEAQLNSRPTPIPAIGPGVAPDAVPPSPKPSAQFSQPVSRGDATPAPLSSTVATSQTPSPSVASPGKDVGDEIVGRDTSSNESSNEGERPTSEPVIKRRAAGGTLDNCSLESTQWKQLEQCGHRNL